MNEYLRAVRDDDKGGPYVNKKNWVHLDTKMIMKGIERDRALDGPYCLMRLVEIALCLETI